MVHHITNGSKSLASATLSMELVSSACALASQANLPRPSRAPVQPDCGTIKKKKFRKCFVADCKTVLSVVQYDIVGRCTSCKFSFCRDHIFRENHLCTAAANAVLTAQPKNPNCFQSGGNGAAGNLSF